jgi:Uncharacterised protein family (UPF0259)
MTPELVSAIKERLIIGQSPEVIEAEVLSLGYTKEVFLEALAQARGVSIPKPPTVMPRARTLFSNGWRFAVSQPQLLLLNLIPGIAQAALVYWSGYNPDIALIPSHMVLALSLLIGLVQAYVSLVTVYMVVRQSSEPVSVKEASAWAASTFPVYLFTVLLSSFIILGGLVFFIIPGLVLAFVLGFSQYAFVKEDKRGIDALLASRDIVKGQLGAVASKTLSFLIVLFLPVIGFGFVLGLAEAFVGESRAMTLGSEAFFQVLYAVLALVTVHGMFHLYEAFSVSKATLTASKTPFYYWLFSLCGMVLVGALLIGLLFYRDTLEEWVAIEAVTTPSTVTADALLSLKELAATTYANNNGTFEGVCEELTTALEIKTDVRCNDSTESWALSARDGEAYWCIDADQIVSKRIPADIGERTVCIATE